jgi:hypothetical protein
MCIKYSAAAAAAKPPSTSFVIVDRAIIRITCVHLCVCVHILWCSLLRHFSQRVYVCDFDTPIISKRLRERQKVNKAIKITTKAIRRVEKLLFSAYAENYNEMSEKRRKICGLERQHKILSFFEDFFYKNLIFFFQNSSIEA